MKNILTILFAVLGIVAFGQTDFVDVADAAKKKAVVDGVTAASKQQKTLSCDFVQEKQSTLVAEKAVSKGRMYYQAPQCLRWEYLSPDYLALIVNRDAIAVKNSKGVTEGNRVVKELAKIIISTIDGSGLQDSKNFSIAVAEGKTAFRVALTPLNKRLANVYSSIILVVDKESRLATSITMNETNGDVMRISFTNHQVNKSLEQNLFMTE